MYTIALIINIMIERVCIDAVNASISIYGSHFALLYIFTFGRGCNPPQHRNHCALPKNFSYHKSFCFVFDKLAVRKNSIAIFWPFCLHSMKMCQQYLHCIKSVINSFQMRFHWYAACLVNSKGHEMAIEFLRTAICTA